MNRCFTLAYPDCFPPNSLLNPAASQRIMVFSEVFWQRHPKNGPVREGTNKGILIFWPISWFRRFLSPKNTTFIIELEGLQLATGNFFFPHCGKVRSQGLYLRYFFPTPGTPVIQCVLLLPTMRQKHWSMHLCFDFWKWALLVLSTKVMRPSPKAGNYPRLRHLG